MGASRPKKELKRVCGELWDLTLYEKVQIWHGLPRAMIGYGSKTDDLRFYQYEICGAWQGQFGEGMSCGSQFRVGFETLDIAVEAFDRIRESMQSEEWAEITGFGERWRATKEKDEALAKEAMRKELKREDREFRKAQKMKRKQERIRRAVEKTAEDALRKEEARRNG